jgi:transketolase
MSGRNSAALREVATQLRIDSVESTTKAGSGHPTSCSSMADIMAVLFFDTMRFDPKEPRNPNNDRFVLSKGHAAPILYAAWAEAGLFPRSELLKLRELGHDLEGHPTPRLSFVDVATGSLGQGLSAGAGMAYAGKHLDHADYRVYVLIGDGESAEGSVWEAIAFASHYKLDNLVAIFDVNRLGQSEPSMLQHDLETYRRRLDAFGWHALVVDGHDVDAIAAAFDEAAKTSGKPTAIIAKTFKGHDFPNISNLENWHGKSLGAETDRVLAHLKAKLTGVAKPAIKPPVGNLPAPSTAKIEMSPPEYKKGDKIATRKAYGLALAKLGTADKRVVALDGDTKNSTFSELFKKAHPDRYIECFIAEQNLCGVAVGVGTRGKIPFASTFATFFTRGFDQIRMAAISMSRAKFVGSHVGVSIGEDGPSQMGLEDIAMFRTVPNCVVFYPSDGVSTERAVTLAANYPGMAFIRTSRPDATTIYDANEPFEIGRAKIVRQSKSDRITIVGSAVTLFEALAAADILAKDGINVRVIDPFTIKPLDKATILASAKETGGLVLTVEDHYPEGGIGDAVAGELADEPAIRVFKLAVRELPRSGKPQELVAYYGIDSAAIVKKVKAILG